MGKEQSDQCYFILMNKILLPVFAVMVLLASCKKDTEKESTPNKQLYPLTASNVWIYVDSFFDYTGDYYGKDTFILKPGKTINFNSREYIPITDQYGSSIFTIRSTDSSVFILKESTESLLFQWPLDESQPALYNSYNNDSLTSVIFTKLNIHTDFPSYRILITKDDGLWNHYKQQELYFTKGLGIIRGRDWRKNIDDNEYTSDSYELVGYSLK